MNKITSSFAAALLLPVLVQAGGIGLVLPVGLGHSETLDGTYGGNLDRDIGSYVGFGLVFDNNLGKNALVNKRTVIEYSSQAVDTKNASYKYSFTTWNIATFYGFGVYKTNNLRIGVGPRINVQYAYSDKALYDDVEMGIGIAPAVSLNWNINESLTLSTDLDYKFQYNFGDLSANSYYTSQSYTSVTSDLTARFYIMYRYGESNINEDIDLETQSNENEGPLSN